MPVGLEACRLVMLSGGVVSTSFTVIVILSESVPPLPSPC